MMTLWCLVARLDETRAELEDEKRQSTSSKMFTEAEVRELRAKYVVVVVFFITVVATTS